MLNLRR